jgi:hypothetical protein
MPLDASAAPCSSSNNEQIFIGAATTSGVFVTRLGVINRITAKNRDLDTARPPDNGAHSGGRAITTAHIASGSSGSASCKQVEIGSEEVWKTGDTSSQDASKKNGLIFTEK